ncbi:Hypothetical_protein [Hexamita inflata]|uniref:Hypothetical_protein n=1 Tax=Hexamita inflata TaxID=28002 RepID=A0AA86Q9A5_9EUKA|nr:Hypothetical protein HINF_LOCUS40646 [Hexamita inflata]
MCGIQKFPVWSTCLYYLDQLNLFILLFLIFPIIASHYIICFYNNYFKNTFQYISTYTSLHLLFKDGLNNFVDHLFVLVFHFNPGKVIELALELVRVPVREVLLGDESPVPPQFLLREFEQFNVGLCPELTADLVPGVVVRLRFGVVDQKGECVRQLLIERKGNKIKSGSRKTGEVFC